MYLLTVSGFSQANLLRLHVVFLQLLNNSLSKLCLWMPDQRELHHVSLLSVKQIPNQQILKTCTPIYRFLHEHIYMLLYRGLKSILE